jgi:hypothetical protein
MVLITEVDDNKEPGDDEDKECDVNLIVLDITKPGDLYDTLFDIFGE